MWWLNPHVISDPENGSVRNYDTYKSIDQPSLSHIFSIQIAMWGLYPIFRQTQVWYCSVYIYVCAY
jgi:hypothetical protein